MIKQKRTPLERISRIIGRWLALLLAPTTISLAAIIITNLATNLATPSWLIITTISCLILSILLYLAAYTSVLDSTLRHITRTLRARRFRPPHVIVLDGTIEADPNEKPATPLQSNRSPADWRMALTKLGWTAELAPLSAIAADRPPDIVLNPFGEVYPEADFLSNASAQAISQYVWNGGVYVNVAGIPFWYRYDPRTGKRETAGRVEGIFEGTAKWISFFHDRFPNLDPSSEAQDADCYQVDEERSRFGNISHAGGNTSVRMFRANPLNPPRLLSMLRDSQNQHCIIGAYLYGQGAFIFASLQIDHNNVSFEKAIAAIDGWARYESNNRTP